MSTTGFFGKLACRGDFITRDLPATFVQPWDHWLAAGIAASQAELGPQWLEAYLVSPLWRFVLAPGLCGDLPVTGVVMPSVDRVGRYFPLTVAQLLPADADLAALVAGPDAWFEAVEHAMLDTLEAQAELEGFEARLRDLPSLTVVSTPRPVGVAGVHRSLAGDPAARGRALQQLACADSSLWWGNGNARIAPGLMQCVGLPPASGFSRLLQDEGERP